MKLYFNIILILILAIINLSTYLFQYNIWLYIPILFLFSPIVIFNVFYLLLLKFQNKEFKEVIVVDPDDLIEIILPAVDKKHYRYIYFAFLYTIINGLSFFIIQLSPSIKTFLDDNSARIPYVFIQLIAMNLYRATNISMRFHSSLLIVFQLIVFFDVMIKENKLK